MSILPPLPPNRPSLRLCGLLAALAIVFAPPRAAARTASWGEGCLPFIPAAERYYHLPAGLILAIALTESGQNGQPYPWALNISGQPVLAGDYQTAASLLRNSDGRPRRDVAVGCMQIHMQYHLDQFMDPEWALHPRYNVWYAALFLTQLRYRYGTWVAAVAHYHGSDPLAQRDYLCHIAHHLANVAPETARHMGLTGCASSPILRPPAADNPPHRPYRLRNRVQAAIMAQRRVGRIIVLGSGRE